MPKHRSPTHANAVSSMVNSTKNIIRSSNMFTMIVIKGPKVLVSISMNINLTQKQLEAIATITSRENEPV